MLIKFLRRMHSHIITEYFAYIIDAAGKQKGRHTRISMPALNSLLSAVDFHGPPWTLWWIFCLSPKFLFAMPVLFCKPSRPTVQWESMARVHVVRAHQPSLPVGGAFYCHEIRWTKQHSQVCGTIRQGVSESWVQPQPKIILGEGQPDWQTCSPIHHPLWGVEGGRGWWRKISSQALARVQQGGLHPFRAQARVQQGGLHPCRAQARVR